MKKINLPEKFALFSERWSPKVIAALNEYHLKIARIEGDFTWHKHDETDEMFLVVEGSIRMDFKEHSEELAEGELIVVPRGVLHRPHADAEAKILMIEPAGTLNTGDVRDEFTQSETDWI
jgi:mannose-6-phosphate isomerase-like protein (cupin superfamily)